MACSIWPLFDIVKSAVGYNDVESLPEIYKDLILQVHSPRKYSIEKLLCAINSTQCSISRHIGAETFIPNAVREKAKKNCIAIR